MTIPAVSWAEFKLAANDMAAVGEQLLYRPDSGEVAIFATVDPQGDPRLAPVSPIFNGPGVYISIGAHTPKLVHLRRTASYALHALVGADDLEFQMRGRVRFVTEAAEHDAVVAAIPFPSYDASDPVVELLIAHALVVKWPERSTRGVRQAFHAVGP